MKFFSVGYKDKLYQIILDDETSTAWLGVTINKQGYITVMRYRSRTNKSSLGRHLLKAPKRLYVDHINGNSLDNRLENLRLVTPQQNNFNVKDNTKRKLPKGVVLIRGKYRAQIGHNRQSINLGTYLTPEAASQAYKNKAKELHGEYYCAE